MTYGIPDLKFDDLIVDFETERAELYTNCDLMFCLELIVHDTLHQGWFADSSVSNYDKLEQVILRAEIFVSYDLERHLHKFIDLILFHWFEL